MGNKIEVNINKYHSEEYVSKISCDNMNEMIKVKNRLTIVNGQNLYFAKSFFQLTVLFTCQSKLDFKGSMNVYKK